MPFTRLGRLFLAAGVAVGVAAAGAAEDQFLYGLGPGQQQLQRQQNVYQYAGPPELHLPQADPQRLARRLEEVGRRYGLVMHDGAIARDEVGDPLLRDPDTLQLDIELWQEEVRTLTDQWYNRWLEDAARVADSFLESLDPLQREVMRADIERRLDEQARRVQAEQNRIAAHARQVFYSVRLRDSWSLRRKTEAQTAAEIAARLTREMDEATEQSSGAIAASDHDGMAAAQLVVEMERWEESFRSGFEQGLQEWSAAERRLLEERFRWESGVQTAYRDGEQEWDAAIAELMEGRTGWIDGMVSLFDSGRRRWEATLAGFDDSYAQVMADMAIAADAESESLGAVLDSHLAAVAQAQDARDLARGGIRFLQEERTRLLLAPTAETAGAVAYIDEQIEFWNQLIADAGGRIRAAESAIRGLEADMQQRFPSTALDPAARAIARLEERLALLDHRLAVAEAVATYAVDRSSARDTESQTRARHDEASAALISAQQSFDQRVAEIERLSQQLAATHAELRRMSSAVEASRRAVDVARQRYESRWEIWYIADTTVMERALQSLEDTVRQWESEGRLDALLAILRYGEALQRSATAQEAEEIRAAILSAETGSPSQLSLAQSRSGTADSLELVFDSPSDAADLRFQLVSAGFDLHESHVERLLQAYAQSLDDPDDELLREGTHDAVRALRRDAAEELFRLELILRLLQEPDDELSMSHSEHLERLIADATTDSERSIILDVYEDLLDVVPAWSESVRREVSQSLADILDIPDITTDPAGLQQRLQKIEQLPFALEWALEVARVASAAEAETGENGHSVDSGLETSALLAEAVALLLEETPNFGHTPSWEEFAGLQSRVLAEERTVAETRDRIQELRGDLAAWRENRDDYYDVEVLPAEAEYKVAQRELLEAQQTYRQLFDVADEVAESIEAANHELNQQNRVLVAARREMQLAQELLDYASGGYELAVNNPLETVRLRREERDRLADSLRFVRSRVAADSWSSLESFDPDLLAAVTARYELYEARNYLFAAAELITSLERDLQLRAGTAARAAGHAVRSLFTASQTPLPDPDLYALIHTDLPEFGSLPVEEYVDAARDYFLTQDPGERQQRANEKAIWMIALANGDGSLLGDFGLAYHYEQQLGRFHGTADVVIRHAASENSNFVALVNDSRVRTDVESALRNAGLSAYERLASDSESYQLYRFFTTIMISDQTAFEESGILPFIEKDLARIAAAHVESAAHAAERRIKRNTGFVRRMFGSKPWRPVRQRRRQMPKFVDGGALERSELMNGTQTVRAASEELNTAIEAFRFDHDLLPGGDSLQQLFAIAQSHGIVTASTDSAVAVLADLLPETGESFGDGFKDLSALISGLIATVDNALHTTEATQSTLLLELATARRAKEQSFDHVVATGVSDDQILADLTHQLYTHPVFTIEGLRRIEYELAGGLDSFSEAGEFARLERLAVAAHGLYRSALDGWLESERQRLTLEREELGLQAEDWQQVMIELHQVGSAEWQRAIHRVAARRSEWRDTYRQEYLTADRQWNERMEHFSKERDLWVREATTSAAVAGGTAAAQTFGLDAEAVITRVEQETANLSIFGPSPPQLGVSRPDFSRLQQLLEHAELRSERHSHGRPLAVAVGMPVVQSGAEALRVAEQAAELIADSVHAGAALISALQLRRQVEEMEQEIDQSIASANRSAAKGFADLLQAAGYTASGGEFRRRVVIDRSLFGGVRRQTQRIAEYQRFVAPEFDIGVDLSEQSLSRLSGEVIQTRVEQAMDSLGDYMALVFGVEDGNAPGVGFDQSFLARYEEAVRQFARSAQYAQHKDLNGLFAFHIGYAPRMRNRNPQRVAEPGYGETGRIMLQYYIFDARQERGIAMLEASAWDIPLWDSSSSPLNAPSLRGVATLGVSIAATLVGQPWMVLAMNAANQSVFAALDIAVTGEDAASVWKTAGINFAQTAAATATSGVFSGFGEHATGFFTEGLSGIHVGGSQLGSSWYGAASLSASNALATETVRAAIETRAADLSGVFATPAAVGYASSALGAGVSAGLSGRWQVDTRDFSHLGIRTDFATDALSGLLGASAGEALRYGLEGTATVNVLNVADLARLGGSEWTTGSGAPMRHGLLEVSFGSNGIGDVQLGGGGVNVSYSSMSDVRRSIDELFQMRRTQVDIDVATGVREHLLAAVDRAVRSDEARFAGLSEAAELLADELEQIRRVQSRRNVDTLFRDSARRNSYAESYLDSQLTTALEQGDVSTDHFLFGRHFDTAGSFVAAYLLYEQGRADATTLFNTEKAFAGTEYPGSSTYEMRVELFLEFYRHDIVRAEQSTSPAMFFGDLLVADAVGGPNGSGLNDPAFQGGEYVIQLVGENNLRGVGDALAAVESLSGLFRYHVRRGRHKDLVHDYSGLLHDLHGRDVFSHDNLYDVFTSGDSAARAVAASYTGDDTLVYRPAYRSLGGTQPGAAFTHYVSFEENKLQHHYRLEVAYRDGVLRELQRDPIGEAEYHRVRDMVEGRPMLTAQLAHHDGAYQLYRSAGLDDLYWRQREELSTLFEASIPYGGTDYFCNLFTNEYAIAYGAPNLQNFGGTQRTANDIHRLLTAGLANGNGRFVEVSGIMAATAGNNGMLVIASQPRIGVSGHLAPVVGFESDGGTPAIPEVNHSGREYGRVPYRTAFPGDRDIHYFLWVPAH